MEKKKKTVSKKATLKTKKVTRSSVFVFLVQIVKPAAWGKKLKGGIIAVVPRKPEGTYPRFSEFWQLLDVDYYLYPVGIKVLPKKTNLLIRKSSCKTIGGFRLFVKKNSKL